MPRRRRGRGSSLWRSDYVVGAGVTNAVRRADVLLGCGDSFLSIEFAIVALDGVTLFLVAPVPVAGNLSGQLTSADAEGERERECDRSKKNRKGGSDDLGGDSELLERHEDREDDDAALPDSRQCRPAVESAGRCHDQSADEPAEYDDDDHDDDSGDDARDVAHQLREDVGE